MQSSSQPSSLGRRAASSPGMHQECRISQFPPSQTGAGRAAASGSGRCRTSASALQALPLCTAGADLDPLASFWAGGAESRCQVIPPSTGHQSSEGGEKPSVLSSRGENLLDCLLLGGWKSEQLPRAGAFHICHPRGGCVSGEALCPLAAPRAKAAAPLRAPEWRPCAVRRRCPASRHPPASPHRAPSEPGACQGRRGLEGRQLRPRGRSQPGGCWSPQTRSGGTRVGRRGHGDTGTAAFPGPAGSPAPLLCPSRASAMNSLSRLNRPGGEGGRYRAKETYILCSHR